MPSTVPAVPETPEQIMARYREKMSSRAAAVAAEITAAPSNIVKLKGKVFTLPDGTTVPGPLRAVVVDFVSSNSLFEGAYNANAPKPPVCWAVGSLDTLRPSANAPKPATEGDCASCPKNQWGTHPGGGKGKACKNQMKIAIMPTGLETPDVSKLYILNVSPTGIKCFSGFVRRIQKMLGDDALPIRVNCEIGFDPLQPYPTLTFLELTPNEQLGVSLNLLNDARELLMREPKGEDE